jgi:hypothetical protein
MQNAHGMTSRWVCSLKYALFSWLLVEVEKSAGLQSQSPLGFLVDPNDNERGFAPLIGRPQSLASVFSPGFCSGIELESLRSNKKGDTQKQDFAIPDQEPRIFDGLYPLVSSLHVLASLPIHLV